MWAVLLSCALSAPPTTDIDTLVVCPPLLRPAMDAWVLHRYLQGHRIRFVHDTSSPQAIRLAVRDAASGGRLKYVLLIGDDEPLAPYDPRIRMRHTPAQRVPAKVNTKWGSEPEIATDNWYADLDDDHVPDVAIGRLTADSPAELTVIVKKILDYEKSRGDDAWRSRINFVAGVGGFNAIVDYLLETATKRFLCDGIPASYDTSMTYGSWRSPYCPDPRMFDRVALQRLNEGCLFWVYIGHGRHTYLDYVRVPGGMFPILDVRHASYMQSSHGAPIAVFLACYTAAFDFPQDCLGEEMLAAPGGPVAVLGGSRVTMPYAMSVMGNALMDECFRQRRDTLGEIVLRAKRRLASTALPDDQSEAKELQSTSRKLLDTLASAVSPNSDQLEEERIEHVQLFNLLGDPLLRMQYPQPMDIEVAKTVNAGQDLTVQGDSPLAGRAVVELVCRRDRFKTEPPTRSTFVATEKALSAQSVVYEQANDHVWNTVTEDVPAGPFRIQLPIPAHCQGPCHVRVFVQGEEAHALQAADLLVRAARVAQAPQK